MARILLVEDDKDSAEALGRYLTAKGHEVDIVADGRAALAAVLAAVPDLMILDLMIPELDGPGLMQVIRSYLRLQSLPVLAWTALLNGPMVDMTRQLGVPVYMKANTTFDMLDEAIRRTLAQVP